MNGHAAVTANKAMKYEQIFSTGGKTISVFEDWSGRRDAAVDVSFVYRSRSAVPSYVTQLGRPTAAR